MNVSITPDLERFVRDKVESGLYNSASEVVREALRLLVAREQAQPHEARAGDAVLLDGTHERAVSMYQAATRLRQALDLLQLGYSLLEQNLRREHPDASAGEISARLASWKASRAWAEEAPGYLERSRERLEKLRRGND
jgi:antitoxin ParD1/3/4